jgi:tetratricopeptide (TPR) repeat protein
MVVDSISLPRDTLKRITGDCDDLTVLYNSLLETVGIETGFITVPGHIYSAFNTKVAGRDYGKVHPDREMTINVEGELWVPVEVTMVGLSDFNVAWRQGIEEWKRYEAEAGRRGFYRTREAQQEYRAVGLKETDLGLQYGEAEEIERGFRRDMGELVDVIVSEYLLAARESGKKQDWNRLGITYAQFNQYAKAEDAFRRALRVDANYLSAKINLGNVAYLRGNYRDALGSFKDSYAALESRGMDETPVALKVLLNISKANFELKRYDESKTYYEMASSIDGQSTERYSYLGSVAGGDDARAAAAGDSKTDILFIDEE